MASHYQSDLIRLRTSGEFGGWALERVLCPYVLVTGLKRNLSIFILELRHYEHLLDSKEEIIFLHQTLETYTYETLYIYIIPIVRRKSKRQ